MGQVLVNGLVVGTTYALIALGLTIAFSIMKVVNFAHGQLYMIGGFVVYYAYGVAGVPLILALVAAAVLVGAIAALCEYFLFRPVIRKIEREEATMLLAMGIALLLEALAFLTFGELQRGAPAPVSGVYRFGDVFLPAGRALVMGVAALLIVALLLGLAYTRHGRALRAMAQDWDVTALQGVNMRAMGVAGFALGGALAGIAGGLLVTIFAVHAGAGTAVSIKAFLMIMIGGAGVVSGAIVGAFILGMAESVSYMLVPGSMTYLVIFVGVIVFLCLRPQGVMGRPWG